MHAAPPVRIACDAAGLWQPVQAALYALSGAVVAMWLASIVEASAMLRTLSALAGAGLAGSAASRVIRPLPSELVWDGRCWSWQGRPGRVDVMLDLDRWLLLRFRSDAGDRVRWLGAAAGGPREGFARGRAALYSPVTPAEAPRR